MTGYTAPCLLKVPLNPGKEKCFLPLLHFSLEDVLEICTILHIISLEGCFTDGWEEIKTLV